jgi:acetyl esterase/lipase
MRLGRTLALTATLCSFASGCGSTLGLPQAQAVGQSESTVTTEEASAELPAFGIQGIDAAHAKATGTEIAYGSDREQRLDVYGFRPGGARRPVMVYVHGGGWQMGDKRFGMQDKPRFFNAMGHVFVSVNYRLARPGLPVGKRPMHPCQIRDVAAAIGWVSRNMATYGGDPSKITLMGHSAGAHLVTIVASRGGYLAEQGLELSAIRGVIANDSAS